VEPPRIFEHRNVCVREHGQAVHTTFRQAEGAADLVAMGRGTRVEGLDGLDGHTFGSEEVQELRIRPVHRMDDQVACWHAGDVTQDGVPAQGVEMKPKIGIDDTRDHAFGALPRGSTVRLFTVARRDSRGRVTSRRNVHFRPDGNQPRKRIATSAGQAFAGDGRGAIASRNVHLVVAKGANPETRQRHGGGHYESKS
jgi:hypothetical protein